MSRFKLILSRKGFDSSNGDKPSPIFEDGTLISLPIPNDNDQVLYQDLVYKDWSYQSILSDLGVNASYDKAHLDPDIYKNALLNRPYAWQACFGQCEQAQTHLCNEKVCKGDIFLFFGWFKETHVKDGKLSYVKGAKDLHVIYGYLQIGEMLTKSSVIEKMSWHPHSKDEFLKKKNNAIYVASPTLLDTDLPGFGTFKFSEDLVLTKTGYSRSKWKLPAVLEGKHMTYHDGSNKKADYFQSAYIGQEFVIKDTDENVRQWIIDLVRKHRYND
jgi:hypothetical protein